MARYQANGKLPNPEEVSHLFEKKFRYQQPADESRSWKLPTPTALFSEYYQLEPLQDLRKSLNAIKSKLNEYEIEAWSEHTRRRDPGTELPFRLKTDMNAEFSTVGWCKIFECLNSYPLVPGPQLNTLHLCEAPGAFITALNHYLYTNYSSDKVQWNWLATTLNPYYEGNSFDKMFIDDRFMLDTLDHWVFHADFSGNIMSRANIKHMHEQCRTRLDNAVHLITADGSINCLDMPDCQEECVAPLHFAELTAALSILIEGGCFVIKMFTLFEASSVCKLYLLNCVFQQVHVFKPATSKRGNSEVYIVCLNYKKQTPHLQATLELMQTKLAADDGNFNSMMPIFSGATLPKDFLLQHQVCGRLFMSLQARAIEANIYFYEHSLNVRVVERRSAAIRALVCKEYYKRYNVRALPTHLTILQKKQKQYQEMRIFNVHKRKGSHSERVMLKSCTTSVAEKIFILCSNLNKIEKSLCTAGCGEHYGLLFTERVSLAERRTQPGLKLYRGGPIEKLHSSLFINLQLLEICKELTEIFAGEPMWQGAARCILNVENQQKEIPLHIADSSSSMGCLETQRAFFLNILKNILELNPKQVMFQNLPFLMHFNVSLLRYLSQHIFNQLNISTEPTFTITLEYCKGKADSEEAYVKAEVQTREVLTSLYELLQSNADIVCILDIADLHRNEFCRALTSYNDHLFLNNYKLFLNL